MSELRKISRKIGYAVILEKKFSASECLQEIEEAARDFCCIEKGNFRNKLFFAFEVAKDAVNFYIFVKSLTKSIDIAPYNFSESKSEENCEA